MSEYSREDADRARNIVQRFLARSEIRPGDRYSDFDEGGLGLDDNLAVSDVESDTYAFSTDLDIVREIDANVPALRVSDEMVPVSLFFVIGFLPFGIGRSVDWPPVTVAPRGTMPRDWWRHPLVYDYVLHTLSVLRNEPEFGGFGWMNREEAQATFLRRATDFVATRIAGVRGFRNLYKGRRAWRPRWPWRPPSLNVRQLLRGRPVTTPGCDFTVSTNSRGLRVFWSGAYYVTPNYFNHPTSPTSSVLQSGTYVFGVDGGAYGNTIQWDNNSVVSLPGLPKVHLNF